MFFIRVWLSSSWTHLKSFQRVFVVHERAASRLHRFTASVCHSVPVRTFELQCCPYPLMTDMLPVSITESKMTAVLPTEEEDDDDGGDAAAVIDQKKSNEKKIKRKMRREKRKLLKKKIKSNEPLDTLMSELPFALTSPTSWKELEFTNTDSAQKKRKRGDSGGRVDSEEDAGKKKKKKESKRPNYFVSIPITNPQISSAAAEVQQVVLQQEPNLAKAMIPIPTLHITLLVTHLANQEQVDLAATALAGVEPSLAELLGGRDLVLPFSGISHFRKEVVFIGLAPGEHRHTLDSLAGYKACRPGTLFRLHRQVFWRPDCRQSGSLFHVEKEAEGWLLPHRGLTPTWWASPL